jgi:adenine-specific DNA-methyltransferase
MGFEENVEFFRLNYLDPEEVDLGRQFDSILPALWLAAGGIGEHEAPPKKSDFLISATSTYGVLFRESRFQKLKESLQKHQAITHVWFVTDSEEAYAEMRAELPRNMYTSMLYRDYLRNFQINTEGSL